MQGAVLVLNSGSSSIKFAVFDPDLSEVLSGAVTDIGGAATLKVAGRKHAAAVADHEAALRAILHALAGQGIALTQLAAAGHRVVHGGRRYSTPQVITQPVIDGITDCVALAPLHNPHALSAIHALLRVAPDLPQCASFDTAFHAGAPEVARRYGIAQDLHDAGLQRYGFHGLSYAALVEALRPDLPDRLLALHLGNGASLCAILNGQGVATSMGYSPLEGLTMGTRCGSIDASVALRLARVQGVDRAEAILNHDSGLKGLAGDNDMATLLARDDADARLAVEHFCYWAARHAGSAVVAMGGLDAIAFTGGIGENAPAIRDRIVEHLHFLGPVPVHVIAAQEERQIARDTRTLMTGRN